jgi:indole-3-glycerol phosphate synthase
MSNFLRQMAESSSARVELARSSFTDDELDHPAYPLHLTGFDLIAEIKNRSPAEGELAEAAGSRTRRALDYVAGGAAAISVLTEPDRFDGELAHLEEVVNAVAGRDIPVMRKDFLVDPVQILEAKSCGASGVLLIAAMLDDKWLTNMLDCAFDHDLFVLLESFDELELERSVHLLQRVKYREKAQQNKLLVGINTRDLRTLAVEPSRLRKFGPFLPADVCCVAESGLHTAEDAANVVGWGYRMALVGTALMRADDPAALIADMLQAGRAV